MPMINMLLAKIYLTAMFPNVEPWIFIFALVTIMTLLNLKGIDLVANFNGVIVFAQLAIIVVFIGLMAYSISLGEGEGVITSVRPFYADNMAMAPLFTGRRFCVSPSSALMD